MNLGQYDEDDVDAIPARALEYGAEGAWAVDCREHLVHEGLVALQCGAFHVSSAGRTYFNTTPLGRAVTGTLLVHAMHEHGVDIWGDGSTHKGNDIERFFRYGVLANPSLRIYKPWLDPAFVDELGGRSELSEYLLQRGLRTGPGRAGVLDRRQHVGCDARGQGTGATRPSAELVEPIMGVRHWDPAVEIVPETVRFASTRAAGGAERSELDRWRSCRGERVGGRHGWAVRPDREPHHRGEEPRGLRGPGHGPARIAYERLVNAIHNEATIENYRTMGRRSAACSTRAAGSTRRR